MNNVAPDRSIAFRGRLQHFQRSRFPPNVNTGQGRPAQYGVEEFLLLALALELLQLGLTPKRSADLLKRHMSRVLDALRGVIGRERWGETFMFLDPHGLADLSRSDAQPEQISDRDCPGFGSIEDAKLSIRGSPRRAMLDLGHLLGFGIMAAETTAVMSAEDFRAELREWAGAQEEKPYSGDNP